jgi:glutamate dehydrogenase (NAD(P)+)
MQRRHEEARNHMLVEELEQLAAKLNMGWTLSDGFKQAFLRGADELELVRSGLDDTMRTAYQSMRALWHSDARVTDLRTAAYCISIGRVAEAYRSKGL